MKRGGPGGGFQWWGPHDRARHSAELLLASVATICALYAAILVAVIVIGIAIDRIDAQPGHESWVHRIGVLRGIAAIVLFVGLVATLLAFVAAGSVASRAVRLARARPPIDGEADHARRCVDDFALAVGFRTPEVFVIDDKAINAFAAGRNGSCAVCLTKGALALPDDQLTALCAQTITSVANRALPLTCAAADLVAVARSCTKAVWGLSTFVLLSTIVGVPIEFAAAATLAIMLLVVCTLPLLALADRWIPRLRDRSAQLADLDAVELTNQPAALARLLLTTAHDYREVATPWQIMHLWFDPDTKRPRGVRYGAMRELLGDPDEREFTSPRRAVIQAHHMLVERARVIVALTSGDPKLVAELERAERG